MDNISNTPGERKKDGKVKDGANLPQGGEEEAIPEIRQTCRIDTAEFAPTELIRIVVITRKKKKE